MNKQELAEKVVDKMMAKDVFSHWLGIEILEVRPGFVKLGLDIRPEMNNGFHITHGGIAYSLADSALAIGLVVLSLMSGVQVDLTGFLFGDLLAMSRNDLIWIFSGAALILVLLARLWRSLLMATIHEELARVEGFAVERLRIVLMLMFSLVIAVAMKIVGVLLITALLIIPAATARRLAGTPEQMALLATGFGVAAVGGGLAMSWFADTPAGPSVVVTSFVVFLLVYGSSRHRTA